MTFAFFILLGITVAATRAAGAWWLCRAPIARVNHELARARARRRRE
jgi:hypothetical protein